MESQAHICATTGAASWVRPTPISSAAYAPPCPAYWGGTERRVVLLTLGRDDGGIRAEAVQIRAPLCAAFRQLGEVRCLLGRQTELFIAARHEALLDGHFLRSLRSKRPLALLDRCLIGIVG